MAQFEELKLVVNLTDNASAGLATLRNELSNVQAAAMSSSAAFQKIGQQGQHFGTQVKGLAGELQKLVSRIPVLGSYLGGLTPHFEALISKMPLLLRGSLLAGAGVGALALGIYRLGNSLSEFGKGQIALELLARTLGTSTGQIKAMTDQMRGVFTGEEAKQQIAKFGNWVQDISRAGSETAAKFRASYGDAGDELMKHVIELYDSGQIEEAWNYFWATFHKSFEETQKETKSPQMTGALMEEALSSQLGGPDISSRGYDVGRIKPATEEQKREAENRVKMALEMTQSWNQLMNAVALIGEQVEGYLLPYMGEVATLLAKHGASLSDGLGKEIDTAAKDIGVIVDTIKAIINFLTPIKAKDAPKILQEKAPMNWFERALRRQGGRLLEGSPAQPGSESEAAGGAQFSMGQGGGELAGGSGSDTLGGMGLGGSGGQWYAHMRRSLEVEDRRTNQERENTEQVKRLNETLEGLTGGGRGPGGLGGSGTYGGGGGGGGGPTFRPGIGPGSGYRRSDTEEPSGPTFASPTSPEGAPEEVSKAMLGTGEGGKYTLGDIQAAAQGAPAGEYTGVGQYNFAGSKLASSMGINITPGTTQDMVTRKTAVGNITANKFAADDIAGFINDLKAAGAPLNNFSGVYSPRQKRGGGGWSQHAYGNAVDIETGFGSGPDNSPYLYKWAQEHPKEFAEIQAKHHMRNLYSERGTHDWGHFEWTPTGKAPPPTPTDAAQAERLKAATKGFAPTAPGTQIPGATGTAQGVPTAQADDGTGYGASGPKTATGGPSITGATSINALEHNAAAQASIARFAAEFPNVKNVKTQIYSLVVGESGMGRNMTQSNQYAGYFALGSDEAYAKMGLTKQQFAALPFDKQMDAYTAWAKRNDPTGRKLTNLGLFNASSNINLQTADPKTVVYSAEGAGGEIGPKAVIANAKTWGAASGQAGGPITVAGIEKYYGRNDPETNRQIAAAGGRRGVQTASANQASGIRTPDADSDRSSLDRGMGNEQAKAEGTINVSVTAPSRTRVFARGRGVFKKVNTTREMGPAQSASSQAGAEETPNVGG